MPSTSSSTENNASATSSERPWQRVAEPDRRMHRDGEHEQYIEGKEPMVVAGTAQHFAGGQAAAHRIEDGGEMHGDGESEHRGGGALRDEQDRGHVFHPNAREIM